MRKPKDVFRSVDGLPELTRGGVRVEFVNLGEGRSGDYNPEDKRDVNLLRFDVSRRVGREWLAVDDGSFCTLMPAAAKPKVLRGALLHIMNAAYDDVAAHGRAKRTLERMSWISPTAFPV